MRVLALVFVPLVLAGRFVKPVSGQEDVDAIYRTVIELAAGVGQAVVRTDVAWSDSEESVRRMLPGLSESVVRAYGHAVRTGEPSLEGRDVGVSIEWLSPERMEVFESGDAREYWRNFRAAFPGARGIMGLSPVGLSEDRREALVALDQASAPRSCSGEFIHLRLQDSEWLVVRRAIFQQC